MQERINDVRNMVESELADSLIKVADDRRVADEKLAEVGAADGVLPCCQPECVTAKGCTRI